MPLPESRFGSKVANDVSWTGDNVEGGRWFANYSGCWCPHYFSKVAIADI